MKKKVLVYAIIVLSVFIGLVIYTWFYLGKAGYLIPRHVQYGFTIQNTTNQLVRHGMFHTWAPVKQTAYQTCGKITGSLPFQIISDRFGNQMLEFELKDIPPYATLIITISVDLMMSDTPNVRKEKELEVWLRPEQYVESDDLDIINTAKKLRKTKKIFEWVEGHFEYGGHIKEDLGARYAFQHKKGDSTEYMYLFTALCRSAGIPARCVEGYIAEENTVFKSTPFHSWSEFYDNSRWYLADPQNKVFKKDGHKYIAMRIITRPPELPEMAFHQFNVKGEGLTAKMNEE